MFTLDVSVVCTLVSLDREQRERTAPVVVTATPSEALAWL